MSTRRRWEIASQVWKQEQPALFAAVQNDDVEGVKRLPRHSLYRGHLGNRVSLALHQAVHLNRQSVV